MVERCSSSSLSSMAPREEKPDAMSSSMLDQFYAQYNNSTNHHPQNRTRQQPPPPPTLQPHGTPSPMALNRQHESHLKLQAETAEAKRMCHMVINVLRQQRSVDHKTMEKLAFCMKFLNHPNSDKSAEKLAFIKKWMYSVVQQSTPRKPASLSCTSGQSSSSNMLPAEDARQPHPQPPAGSFHGPTVSNVLPPHLCDNVPNQSTTTTSHLGPVPPKRGRPKRPQKSGEAFLLEKPEKKVQKRQGMLDVKVKQETQLQQQQKQVFANEKPQKSVDVKSTGTSKVLHQKPAPAKAVVHNQHVKSATLPPSSSDSELEKTGIMTDQALAATVSGRKVTEEPFSHLVNLVQRISGKALSASVDEIWSIVNLSDRIPGGKKMNRWFDVVSSSSFDPDISTAGVERNQALREEVRTINQQLVDTDVAIIPDGNARTIMKCSFNAASISPMQPIEPLKLLVPANYPQSSPVLLETLPVEISGEDDLSVKAKSRLHRCLRSLLHPVTLEDIARSWDVCARQVITEYALQNGGGSFSSQYGTWETVEDCLQSLERSGSRHCLSVMDMGAASAYLSPSRWSLPLIPPPSPSPSPPPPPQESIPFSRVSCCSSRLSSSAVTSGSGSSKTATLSAIQSSGIIACLCSSCAEIAFEAASAALDGGISVLEITMSTPGVFQVLKRLVEAYPAAFLGVGTVLSAADAMNAMNAGARFLMSPATVKVYPVSALGGVQYIAALKKPFSDIPMVASQGITTDSLGDYITAGASAVVLSDAIFSKEAMLLRDFSKIHQLALHASSQGKEAVHG
ncbi:unnamed protein product [Linum tenue]|uniref:ARC105/Med15 mediator subunit C-terminal domain-containing protein n=1 Tax=Linum tenue TaxID=586396 RepID=A0AAV0KFE1_9ROSI|nr:unnamed protein product [Linum tenue]